MTGRRSAATVPPAAAGRQGLPDPGSPDWITSPLLLAVPQLLHGFSTRSAGNARLPAVARHIAARAGARELRLLEQVHGTHIVPVGERTARPRGDGWAGTPAPGLLFGVVTADCVPVLLCCPGSRTIALAHAGWRGAVAGVAERALAGMGTDPGRVHAALGPAIGPCCYQVGAEVAEVVGDSAHLSVWEGAPGKYRLDLPGLVAARLRQAGADPRTVEVLRRCTRCKRDRFFSHRGGDHRSRMVAFLGWAQPAAGEAGG